MKVAGWVVVVAAVAGIGVGAWAMTRFAPAPDRAVMGQRPPDYRLEKLPSGDSISLRAAYKGKVTLINIWATWCGPCRREMPSIERLYISYQNQGFRVAAVSVDEGDSTAILAYARQEGLTFDILHDRSGNIQQLFQTIGVPQSFLIGRDGRVAYTSLGADAWDSPEMRRRVEQLLGSER